MTTNFGEKNGAMADFALRAHPVQSVSSLSLHSDKSLHFALKNQAHPMQSVSSQANQAIHCNSATIQSSLSNATICKSKSNANPDIKILN